MFCFQKQTQCCCKSTVVSVVMRLSSCPRTGEFAVHVVRTRVSTATTNRMRYGEKKYALLCVCMHVSMHYFLLRQYVCRLQVFWYFPLEHQINQLLKNKKYTYALKYEGRRSQNARYMSDVYDSPRWQEVAGTMTGDRVTRIVVQLCVDAFPWSSRKHQVFLLLISFFFVNFSFFFQTQRSKIQINSNSQRCCRARSNLG